MVIETVEIDAHILDFHLDSAKTATATEAEAEAEAESATPAPAQCSQLQRPCGNPTTKQQRQQQQTEKQLQLQQHLPPNSAEHLSWKFFEHVSCLDKQLRGGVDDNLTTIEDVETNVSCRLRNANQAHTSNVLPHATDDNDDRDLVAGQKRLLLGVHTAGNKRWM